MAPIVDIAGLRVGRLAVVALADRSLWRNANAHWVCQCDCGTTAVVRSYALQRGKVRSCGCLMREHLAHPVVPYRHGHTTATWQSQEYRAWASMIQRCHNPRHPRFRDWGGRGIRVCDEWRADFMAFLAHIGPKPSPELSLDRIDNNGNCEPGNVRWATAVVQRANQRPKSRRRSRSALR